MSDEQPKRGRGRPRKYAPSSEISAESRKEINKNLTAIYTDHGHMPDMKRIKVKRSRPFLRILIAFVIVGGLLAAAAWSGFFALPGSNKVSESQMELKIEGPVANSLGAEAKYVITYENKLNVVMRNAVLTVNYPEGFSFKDSSAPADNAGHTEWKIGTIFPKQQGNITITGKNYGALNQEGSWRVFLVYKPDNFNSELQKVATYNTKISESPFSAAVSGPDKAAVGNDSEYTFALNAIGDWRPDRIEFAPLWPDNFYPSTSAPALDKTGRWIIPSSTWYLSSSTTPADTIIFKARGKFGDSQNQVVPVKAVIYLPVEGKSFQIGEASLNTELVKSNLNLSMAINGSLKNISSQPGDILNMTVSLKNASPDPLNKVALKIILDTPSAKSKSILDWANIVDKYNGDARGEQLSDTVRRGIISWNNKMIPDLNLLKKDQEVVIDVRLPIKDAKAIGDLNFKEYKINATVEAQYVDAAGALKTISSNPIVITLNSDLKFESLDNITTKDGKDQHEITWKLTNSFHPLKNLTLTADMYGDVSWQNPAEVPAGDLKYDPAAKHITWTIPEMPESVDVLALPFSLVVNTKNPTQDVLVSKVHIVAEDTVTGENLDFMGDEILLNPKTVTE